MRVVIPTNSEACWSACADAITRNEPLCRLYEYDSPDVTAVLDGLTDRKQDSSSDWIYGAQPFCFSRNVNMGIRQNTQGGVIILNHDALLETPGGFSSMVAYADQHPEYGVVSSAIRGACCNPAQEYVGLAPRMEDTDVTVAFVCVYIPRRTLDTVGLLDERLTGYGREDDLYCLQVRKAGLKIGIWHGCVVEHASLPSSYRTRPDCGELADRNLRIFAEIVKEQGLEPWLSEDQKAAIARGRNA